MEKISIKDRMTESANSKLVKLRNAKSWMATAPIKKLVDQVDYLAEKYEAQVYASMESYAGYIFLTLDKLTGLKDQNLADFLESLIYANPDSQSTCDVPSSYSREYSFRWYSTPFENNGESCYLVIQVTAKFSEDSDTCKRVIVGYTEPSKEPTPIYKLECVNPDEPQAEPITQE